MRTDNLEFPILADVPPWPPRQPAPSIPAKAGPVTQMFWNQGQEHYHVDNTRDIVLQINKNVINIVRSTSEPITIANVHLKTDHCTASFKTGATADTRLENPLVVCEIINTGLNLS